MPAISDINLSFAKLTVLVTFVFVIGESENKSSVQMFLILMDISLWLYLLLWFDDYTIWYIRFRFNQLIFDRVLKLNWYKIMHFWKKENAPLTICVESLECMKYISQRLKKFTDFDLNIWMYQLIFKNMK